MDKAKRWIDAHSMEVNAAVNVAIVGSVAFGSVFQIVEVDSDISAGWTIWEILRNIPRDNLDAYQQSVFDNPLPTKALTSGVAYTLGDFTCQLSQGKKITTVDLKRSLRSGAAGFMIHGPLCHYWLMWTEENLSFDGALWAIPVKVFADQTVWSLFLNCAYTTCIMSLQGMKPGKIKGEIEATWWNAITAGWRFWPFVHTLTFSPLIPQDFKLLFVDCVEVVWVTILSAAVNRDSEKALQVRLRFFLVYLRVLLSAVWAILLTAFVFFKLTGAAQRRSRTAGDSAHGADGLAVRVRGGRRGDTVRPGEVTVEHIRVIRGAARGRHVLGLRYV